MEDKSIIADQLGELEEFYMAPRRQLLSWWLKIFSYIFVFAGILAVFLYPLSFLMDRDFSFSLYGLEGGGRWSVITLIVTALFILKGVASIGLLTEKDWAMEVCLIDAILGMAVCLFVMIYSMLVSGSFVATFRLELAFLIIYLIKIIKIMPMWKKSLPSGK